MADEYIHKSFDGGAEKTALTSGFTVGAATLTVVNGTSFPDGSSGPFVVVVDRGLANEEKFLIDTTSGVNNVTFTIQQAGYDGTSPVNHSIGALVEHCLDAYTVEQANRYVNLQTTKGSLVTHTGTTTTSLTASGTNNLTLLTDSTIGNGIKWGQLPTAGIADGNVTYAKLNSDVTDRFPLGKVGEMSFAGAVTGGDENGTKRDEVTVTGTNRLMMIACSADDVAQFEIRLSTGGTALRTDDTVKLNVFNSHSVTFRSQLSTTTYELWNSYTSSANHTYVTAYIIDLGPL